MDIRVVAANPRSFCYLDERRWFPSDEDGSGRRINIKSSREFRRPYLEELEVCPYYDTYIWGLRGGGEIPTQYRDNASAEVGSLRAIAERYASRDVIYLSGELDVAPQSHDHCPNVLQGNNRNDKARNFFGGLQEYFGRRVHELHFVPNSGHDHAIMFQSSIGRKLILGERINSKSLSELRQDQQQPTNGGPIISDIPW
jgi:hypothetical protein